MSSNKFETLQQQIASLKWYHTIELTPGITTPGDYDHRPFLPLYGFPKNLKGKTVLDIGAASGFFSFEFEKRGARVTATDLPEWLSHDFGPLYEQKMKPEEAEHYLHDPFLFAKQLLNSRVERKEINIYDISPETVGTFDFVFCGSVLLHLTDPIKALWHIQSVTREAAVIATVIQPITNPDPYALFQGHQHGDIWWIPNRACLEMMITSAGFKGWEWFSEFRLDHTDRRPHGPYHGVIRAWNTSNRPSIFDDTDQPETRLPNSIPILESETDKLNNVAENHEQMSYFRLKRYLKTYTQKLKNWFNLP